MKVLPLCLLFLTLGAQANASRPGAIDAETTGSPQWSFKLTPSYYATSKQTAAVDVNLRANSGPHALWLGYYQRGNEFEQTRAGYELTLALPHATLVPSLQIASHGFAGGSLNLQLGDEICALLGIGRTNAGDYYNLNFDPNDSAVYGLGTRLLPQTTLSLYTVRDNRLHTEQVVNHAVARYQLAEHQRLSLDLFRKHGRPAPDEASVSGNGLALGYDDGQLFLHLARDRKVNFSNDNQTRVSLGWRF